MSVRNDPQRREAILEAAWACFVQHGYAKTSLEDVARRAGLSRPLIYLHFANKNELFGCVIENLVHGYYEAASAVLAQEADRKTRLLRVVEAWVLGPLAMLGRSPQGEELFDQVLEIGATLKVPLDERTRQLLAGVIEDRAAAEVFQLALKGLLSDHPAIETMQARVAVLAEHFLT